MYKIIQCSRCYIVQATKAQHYVNCKTCYHKINVEKHRVLFNVRDWGQAYLLVKTLNEKYQGRIINEPNVSKLFNNH